MRREGGVKKGTVPDRPNTLPKSVSEGGGGGRERG